MAQKHSILSAAALVLSITALVAAFWLRRPAETAGDCGCEALAAQIAVLRSQITAGRTTPPPLSQPAVGLPPVAPSANLPTVGRPSMAPADPSRIAPPVVAAEIPPPKGLPKPLPSDPPPPPTLDLPRVAPGDSFPAGAPPPPVPEVVNVAPPPVGMPSTLEPIQPIPPGDAGVKPGVVDDKFEPKLFEPAPGVVEPKLEVDNVPPVPVERPPAQREPDPTPTLRPPDAGVVADSGVDRFVRFESSNPAVDVQVGPDGQVLVQNSDPALTGTELAITGHTRSGRALPLTIKVPAVDGEAPEPAP